MIKLLRQKFDSSNMLDNFDKILDKNTLLFEIYSDKEIFHKKGFIIQPSATQCNNFAIPYYPRNFILQKKFEKKQQWKYDFSFIGKENKLNLFFHIVPKFIKKNKVYKSFYQTNKDFFYQDGNYNKKDEKYACTIYNSKFVLCPERNGLNSFRFFETLASNNIPIYIGNPKTKFPLEWIIDWNQACFRINYGVLNHEIFFEKQLKSILSTNLNKINQMREYIFFINNEYLNYNKRELFIELVKNHLEQLIKKK